MPNTDIVTVYCCGTAFSRERTDEAVAATFAWDTGRKWINDGPGNPHHLIQKVESLMDETQAPTEDRFSKFWTWKNVSGKAGGKGTGDNVVMSLQWLWLEYYDTRFTTVNLCGWSRGAVTCIMIAHAMHEAGFSDLGIETNIFCFDPVPGGVNDFGLKGTFDSTGRVGSPDTLPANVNHYSAILMENEKKPLFSCVSPRELGDHTQCKEYPLPGSHSNPVKFQQADNPVGKIGLHLCHDFLLDHGTELADERTLTGLELLEEYSKVRIKFWKSKKKYIRGTSWMRSGLITNEYRKDLYFINGHHFELFRQFLPNIYQAFVSQNRTVSRDRLNALLASIPKTLAALNFLQWLRHPNDNEICPYIVEIPAEVAQEAISLDTVLMGTAHKGVYLGTTFNLADERPVWSVARWKSASNVTFGTRRGQAEEIDKLLPLYHELNRYNKESGKRVLLLISPIIRDHLTNKTTSNRREAMYTLGRQVLAALRA